MNPIKRVKSEGISLKIAHILMILLTFILMCLLLFFTFQSGDLYSKLSDTTNSYITLQKSADSLMEASDYLTDKVQLFTVMNDPADMEAYFDEVNNVHRREDAVMTMSDSKVNAEASRLLREALNSSVELMDMEYAAMKLVCEAKGYTIDHEEVSNAVLPAECADMTPEEKIHCAQEMVHGSSYYDYKMSIRGCMENCISVLIDETHWIQSELNDEVHSKLVITRIFLVIQSVAMILMLWMTSYLGINPILKGVKKIRENRKMPVMGSYEFRYLAKTYNKMYEAFQKSIESLNYEASHDKLTDLYNRAGYDLISESINLNSTAVIIIDADQFKEINDTYGHTIGDSALKKIADAMRYTFRREDYICRVGGDEFVVFMLHMDEKRRELIRIKIDHINNVLSDTSDGLPEMSVSVGVAFGSNEPDLKSAVKHADEALYRMKADGKHGCAFYSPKEQKTDTDVRKEKKK